MASSPMASSLRSRGADAAIADAGTSLIRPVITDTRFQNRRRRRRRRTSSSRRRAAGCTSSPTTTRTRAAAARARCVCVGGPERRSGGKGVGGSWSRGGPSPRSPLTRPHSLLALPKLRPRPSPLHAHARTRDPRARPGRCG
jgi:hypothetical protein